VLLTGVAGTHSHSFVETSDNVVIESLRREGKQIEMRMVECLGVAGAAELRLSLPHRQAFLTDLLGGNPKPLKGGPRYSFPIRPQQIVTIRFTTDSDAGVTRLLTSWDHLVPENKRAMLNEYSSEKGHPPLGD
jgi:hypothetical protein